MLLPIRVAAMRHQLGNNEFFVHLFAFKKLREAQDKLYYDELAPKSAIRKQVEGIPMGDPLSPACAVGTCAWMEME